MQNKLVSIHFEKVKGIVTCWIRFQISKGIEDISHEDFIIPARIGRTMIRTFRLKKKQTNGVEYYLLNEK